MPRSFPCLLRSPAVYWAGWLTLIASHLLPHKPKLNPIPSRGESNFNLKGGEWFHSPSPWVDCEPVGNLLGHHRMLSMTTVNEVRYLIQWFVKLAPLSWGQPVFAWWGCWQLFLFSGRFIFVTCWTSASILFLVEYIWWHENTVELIGCASERQQSKCSQKQDRMQCT